MTDTEQLTKAEADLIYGMLTQRLYLRSDDPERDVVQAAREKLYPLTTSYAEMRQAADDLGIDFDSL